MEKGEKGEKRRQTTRPWYMLISLDKTISIKCTHHNYHIHP